MTTGRINPSRMTITITWSDASWEEVSRAVIPHMEAIATAVDNPDWRATVDIETRATEGLPR